MSKSIQETLAQRVAENMNRHSAASHGRKNTEKEHVQILLDKIDPNPFQPRRKFREDEISSLAESIQENGLIQPISLRQVGPRYQIVYGERRWRAHKQLGMASIEAMLVEMTDEQMAIVGLIENIQREDLSDYEIGMSLIQMQQFFKTRTEMAKVTGINREDMYRYLAFGDLPAWLRAQLDKNPRLFSRVSATQIKAAINEYGNIDRFGSVLESAIAMIEAGKLLQTQVGAYLSSRLSEKPKTTPRPLVSLMKNGKRVGSFERTPKGWSIKLKPESMTAAQETALENLLEEIGRNK